ncbi:MAG: hypothetical protein PHY48_03485 [Candidatus Cloacimonetes bacterium]|nr:hypothetical protein [Candidatus Cloacimonadota bacterium]
MKQLVGLLLLLALCGMLAATDIRLAVGLDTAGETVGKDEGFIIGFSDKTAATFSAQIANKYKNLGYGFGVDYQSTRECIETPGGWRSGIGEHYFVPVYGLLSYNFPSTDNISTEVLMQLGYSFTSMEFQYYDDDERYSVKDGMFTGVGFGINYKQFSVNALYRVNYMKTKKEDYYNNAWETDYENDNQTRQFNVSLGYRFGLKLP